MDTTGVPVDRRGWRAIAGLALVGVGVLSTMGIITAEALYPGYSTASHTISVLGGASGPGGVVEPSATIFNGSIILSGLLVFVAAAGLDRVYRHRPLTAVVVVAGVGLVGVGVFPTQYDTLHGVAALLAFGGTGLSAIVAARVAEGPMTSVSAAVGLVVLVALALFVTLESANPLGIGGLERWVSYPAQVWTVGFGGYLLGNDDSA